MNIPNGAADLLTSQDHNERPLQLPKVGWDDDGDGIAFSSSLDPPSAPIPPSRSKHTTDSGSGTGVTFRSSVARSEMELQPIPEDMSMHGPWPELCAYYDYDQDRKKAYRYRMCGRLTFRSGMLIVLGFALLVVVLLSRRGPPPSSNSSDNDNPPPKLTQEQAKMYELIATSFHPLWYDRSRGWNGTAYLQAYEFCNSVESGRVPCPYVAYCPLGAGHAPSGGTRRGNDEVSWAPILDEQNAWVQVGSSKTCELYSAVHGKAPRWGLTGIDDEEITRYIMCCLNSKDLELPDLPEVQDEEALGSGWIHRPPSLEEDEQGKGSKTSSTNNDENLQSMPQQQINENQSTNQIEEQESSQQIPTQSTIDENTETESTQQYSPSSPTDPTPKQTISPSDLEQLVLFFEPLWFDRDYGWSGTTIDEAEEFCNTEAGERSLCPYIAYCPNGLVGTVREYTTEKELEWSPTKENNGMNWVGVGKENACSPSDENEFGSDAAGIWEKTGHIMCCKEKSSELDYDDTVMQ